MEAEVRSTAPAATAPRFDTRTRVLLEGPIASTLLRLATPNVLVMFVQASVGLIETYFVAKLGTAALAGGGAALPPLLLGWAWGGGGDDARPAPAPVRPGGAPRRAPPGGPRRRGLWFCSCGRAWPSGRFFSPQPRPPGRGGGGRCFPRGGGGGGGGGGESRAPPPPAQRCRVW